jgi:hypothetical protein
MKDRIRRCVIGVVILTVLVSCATGKGGPVTIEIPFTMEYGNIVVEATVNGETGKYNFDVLSNVSAFRKVDPAWPVNGQGDFKRPEGLQDTYLPEELIIGGIPVKVRTEIIHDPANEYLVTHGLDGVVGVTAFGGYWCEVSFDKQKITLHRQKPGGYSQSVEGYFLAESILFVPGTIDGTDYGFVIYSKEKIDAGPIILPAAAALKQPHIQFIGKDGTYTWAKTGSVQVLGDSYTGVIGGTDPWLAELDQLELTVSGRNISSMNIGALTLDFLRNYDLLFDFTGLSYNKTDRTKSPKTRIWYAAHDGAGERAKVVSQGYPGGEWGAFVYCTPQGADLFLTKDSPVRSLGITEDTTVTRINGVPTEQFAAEAGDNIVLDIDPQMELTILGTDKQEQVIALSQISGR